MNHPFASLPRFWVALVLLAGVPWSAWASSDRYAVLVSDLHIGAGRSADHKWRREEDFRWEPEFDKFLDWIDAQGQGKTDLVLVGDVFELWQSPFMTCSRDPTKPGCIVPDCHDDDTDLGCSEMEAEARLAYTLDQHADFVAAIKAFADRGANHVYFVPGNHDAALLFDGVQKLLAERLATSNAEVLHKGYWLSADGRIYADHGHQFDDVNKFAKWPSPFIVTNGVTYMRKPWGENMVQQFYNQYEEIFPIVDNLSNEKAGVKYAVQQSGIGSSVDAVAKFFRFFLFQESVGQGFTALGREGAPLKWNYGAIQAKDIGFFVQVLDPTQAPGVKARQAQVENKLAFDPKSLSHNEIDALCGAKEVGDKGEKCPVVGDRKLGAAVAGLLLSEKYMLTNYLQTTLPDVRRDGQSTAAIYVFGHTHHAVAPTELVLPNMPGGAKLVNYVNTGAFQRVAGPAQIDRILARQTNPAKKSPLDLDPEDLPPCYTFVSISPYSDKPIAKSMTWIASDGATFVAAPGTCLN